MFAFCLTIEKSFQEMQSLSPGYQAHMGDSSQRKKNILGSEKEKTYGATSVSIFFDITLLSTNFQDPRKQ